MSEYVPVPGIIGTDGVVPVYSPNSRWKVWNKNEIYDGTIGTKRYVPNVKDLVLDQSFFVWYEVISIDEVTYLSTLKEIDTRDLSGDFSDTDMLLGVGPGTQSDTYRVYLDKSVTPYVLAIDARLRVAGTMCTSCKIFKGSNLSNEANVISKLYDASNNFLGTTIPLELVAMSGNNTAIKTVKVCNTSEDLQDGEVVTAVFYSEAGHVVSKRQLLVENTAFIRSTDDSVKYIIDISIKSPFINQQDPLLIEYPINVPLSGLFLTGVIHYSDGTTEEIPIDGTKFKVFGFDNFVSTIVGQKLDIVLKYTLAENEISYNVTVAADRFITKSYKAIVSKADGAYTMKLFGYPNWIDGINGYRMEWFIHNLDRNLSKRVTPYVRINENTQVFDPLLFGSRQRLSVSLNLQDISGVYKYYIHTQSIDVTLLTGGGSEGTNWMVGFDPTQNPQFGVGNKGSFEFINQDLKKIRLDLGLTDYNEWLNRLYYTTKPLVNPYNEADALIPTHFRINVNNEITEFPVSQWNQLFTTSANIWHGMTVFVEFIKRTNNNDLLLAVAGIPVKQVQNLV